MKELNNKKDWVLVFFEQIWNISKNVGITFLVTEILAEPGNEIATTCSYDYEILHKFTSLHCRSVYFPKDSALFFIK